MSSKVDRALISFELTCADCLREVSVTCYRDTFHYSDVVALMRTHNCCRAIISDSDHAYKEYGIMTTFDHGFGLVFDHSTVQVAVDASSYEARSE